MDSSDLVTKSVQLPLVRRTHLRREGSLAAALAQSMALAMIGTAGAYPSWVLVRGEKRNIVLGASWAVNQVDPPPDSPLLGSAGGPIMFAIASCCLVSVVTGSLALTLDFLGLRQGRSLAPLVHGLTAVLVASSAACGSCLLALIRGRVRTEPALAPFNYSVTSGQSLFLSFLACILAATATGLSCSSPARVEPARSSWDLGRPVRRRTYRASMEERPPSLESVVWQEDGLSPFLLAATHSEDEVSKRPCRYKCAAQDPDTAFSSRHSFLRSMLQPSSSFCGLESLQGDSSVARYWKASSFSTESRLPLRAPAPSLVASQVQLKESEDDSDLEPQLPEREPEVRETNSGV